MFSIAEEGSFCVSGELFLPSNRITNFMHEERRSRRARLAEFHAKSSKGKAWESESKQIMIDRCWRIN